ncbi:MAG TPA: FAD binding domain-containing protein [Castellaniella sp.]|nr:FAD binding domain-containing protein [Castellaniella sp.]
MKPSSFDYVRADRVEDIFEAFEHYGPEARILAGGQSLMAMINYRLARPKALIDISRCAELDYVQVRDAHLVVGAAVTQTRVQQRDALAQEVPLLHLAFPYISHFQVRNRGTVCGSIAHADPSAELPLCLAALQGKVVLRSKSGRRTLAADEFFTGMLMTALDEGEFIEEVQFPLAAKGHRYRFDEMAMRRGDFAIVSLAVVASASEIALTIGGVSDRPVTRRWPQSVAGDLPSALAAFAWDLQAQSDPHVSASYRRHLVRSLGQRLITEVLDETVS